MAQTNNPTKVIPVEFRPARAERVPILVLNLPARMPDAFPKAGIPRRPNAATRNFTLLQLARRQQLKQSSFERKFAVYGQQWTGNSELKIEFKS